MATLLLVSCGSQTKTAAPPPAPAAPARITQFYAAPPAIAPGDRSLLCYGVEDTRAVRLDPPVDTIAPSLARCVEARPGQTTEYRLIATGQDGAEAQAVATVTVDPRIKPETPVAGPTLIRFFTASATTIPAGGKVTLCYGVEGARSVTITPTVRALEPVAQACFSLTLDTTTPFTLTATSTTGGKDSEKLTIEVR